MRAGVSGHGVDTRLFVQARLRVHAERIAQEKFHDVSEVYADVEQDAAGILLVTPHGDQHAISAADGIVHHEARRADCADIEQGFGEAVNRVAPVVFCYGQDASGAL